MSLETRLTSLVQAIGADIKALQAKVNAKAYGTVNLSTAQSLATNSTQPISFLSDRLTVTNGMAWDATNKAFVVPRTGRYLITASIRFAATAAGVAGRGEINFQVDGTSVAGVVTPAFTNAQNTGGSLVYPADLTANQQVRMVAYQNSGAAVSINTNQFTYISICEM